MGFKAGFCICQCDREGMGTEIDVWCAMEDWSSKSVDEVYGVLDRIRKSDRWQSLM